MDSLALPKHINIRAITNIYKLVRLPNLLIIIATQYLIRVFLVGSPSNYFSYLKEEKFFLLSLSTLFIAAAGYIINDYYDVKIDIINKPDRVVIGTFMRRRIAMAFHTILNFSGIFIGFYLSPSIGTVNLCSAVWLWLYSNQLKRMPLVGNFSVAFLSAAALLIVELYFRSHNHLIYFFSIFAFFISFIREIIKDMEDIRGDMRYGCKTLPIIWGIRKTKILVYFLLLIFFVSLITLLIYAGNKQVLIYFWLMLMPSIYFIRQLYRADSTKQFHRLSTFCKLAILFGLGMIVLI
ncbi:geranylgeranylglycerol-phosphate geranylgeranyltransferase [Flammeovirgaceae bacterium SG7u.111]|nr:geranylgeranylglycerol-phosphate geranylgeranyltransferase [Flammeovirgaceae bacterium SG7u.132]WPO35542.1 geranylgeranylglycerol-phosphate geranylgeranyltransferase [Flammeovirgaceae bacterium SG7u.111]